MKVNVKIKKLPKAYIKDATHKVCPICGQPYLRVGQYGDPIFGDDVYHMTCDNCDFTSPWGSNDYGEAYFEMDDWIAHIMK